MKGKDTVSIFHGISNTQMTLKKQALTNISTLSNESLLLSLNPLNPILCLSLLGSILQKEILSVNANSHTKVTRKSIISLESWFICLFSSSSVHSDGNFIKITLNLS